MTPLNSTRSVNNFSQQPDIKQGLDVLFSIQYGFKVTVVNLQLSRQGQFSFYPLLPDSFRLKSLFQLQFLGKYSLFRTKCSKHLNKNEETDFNKVDEFTSERAVVSGACLS